MQVVAVQAEVSKTRTVANQIHQNLASGERIVAQVEMSKTGQQAQLLRNDTPKTVLREVEPLEEGKIG